MATFVALFEPARDDVMEPMGKRRPRVLMTLADVAWPIDAGKRLRAEALVRAVAHRCDIDVVVLFADADPADRPLPPDLSARWVIVPHHTRSAAAAGFGVLSRLEPWESAVHDWSRVRRAIDSFSSSYDLVYYGALHHFSRLRKVVPAPRMIVDCDDVETDKLRRFLQLPTDASSMSVERIQRRIELPMWGRIQRRAVADADAVLVCSELDRRRLIEQSARGGASAAAHRIVSIPNTYPDPGRPTERQLRTPYTFAIIANYGTDQNMDAIAFTVERILPALRRQLPGLRVRLIGRRADRLANFAGIEGLDIVGSVESVAEELARAHAVLVPMRYGGGTRLKILEAMAYGVPVLSTRVGAEGLGVVDDVHLLLAETGEQFADQARRLLLDEPALAARLTSAARSLYEKEFRPSVAEKRVGEILDRLFASTKSPAGITLPPDVESAT